MLRVLAQSILKEYFWNNTNMLERKKRIKVTLIVYNTNINFNNSNNYS